MHSPHSTGEQFARMLHGLNGSEAVALPPTEPIGNFVLQILDTQPGSPLVSTTVHFTGHDPESGMQVMGAFNASREPLDQTLRLHPIKDLAVLE